MVDINRFGSKMLKYDEKLIFMTLNMFLDIISFVLHEFLRDKHSFLLQNRQIKNIFKNPNQIESL